MCYTCGKGFTQKVSLQRHQASHSDERKHKCTLCPEGRFFKTKNDLSGHMNYHYEPKHECKLCGKKFHRSSDLNTHMKIHFDPTYSCLQCGKKFHTSRNLKSEEKLQQYSLSITKLTQISFFMSFQTTRSMKFLFTSLALICRLIVILHV